jgi:hypothetical protein
VPRATHENAIAPTAPIVSIRLDRIVTDSLVTPVAKSAASTIALPLDTNWSATKRQQSLLSSAPNAELFRVPQLHVGLDVKAHQIAPSGTALH